jgi:hypothetical protein
MERIAFLVERSGQRIDALLNPEGLTLSRQAGLRPRGDATGALAGDGLGDDALQATGGGITQLDLRLLFDTALAAEFRPAPGPEQPPGASPEAQDVREMTRPLWNLAENGTAATGAAPPLVRFIWGSAWNIPGVIVALAERLDRFTPQGVPQRAWLRLRLRRVAEAPAAAEAPSPVTPLFEFPSGPAPGPGGADGEDVIPIPVPVAPDGMPELLPWQASALAYDGDPRHWPLIYAASNVENPLSLPEGTVLRAPPLRPARPG